MTSINKTKHLVVIAGPTGIGKTDLTIRLAQDFKSEIISADSRQFFKELKIGTAAPTAEELAAAPHHLIGNISIHDYYNVYLFEQDVLRILEGLFKVHDIVFLVGGSGLYIDALCNGIDDIPDVDEEVRNKCVERLELEGIESLRFELKRLDPEIYDQIDLRNPKRVLRALEVCLSSGKPYSSFRVKKEQLRDFNITRYALNMDREKLYDRINLRVDKMVENGLIEEAEKFYPQKNLNSLNTVGYKELFDHFDGNSSLETAIDLIKRNSRRYAKRQLSWNARDKSTTWWDVADYEAIKSHIENLLQKAL